MHFMVLGRDKEGATEHRAATRPRHLAYYADVKTKILLAGPLLEDGTGNPIGSMLVVEADDIEDVRKMGEGDPYFIDGVFESLEVVPMRLGFGALVPQDA